MEWKCERLDGDVEAAATNDDGFTNVPRGSGLMENDEVRCGSSTPSLRHSSMLRILVKAILLSVPHIDLPLHTITTCRDGTSCQIAVNLRFTTNQSVSIANTRGCY